MRIAIEGQRLFREKKHGMDFVALELIKNLMKIDKENEYFVFVAPDKDKCLHNTTNFKIIELEGGSYPMWEQIALPKAVKEYGCELLQCTSNTAPIYSPVPFIVILHDIIYMESVALFRKGYSWYQKIGNMYRRFVVPRILKKAAKVITVSNFERNRIKEFFQLKEEKIVAIYNGVGEHFMQIEDQEYLEHIKEKYSLPEHYFFFLGNTDPKKNTKGVLKAYSAYVKKQGKDIKLLMLDYDEVELLSLLQEIGDSQLREQIYLAGYVNNQDLPAIYNMADLFLYPSLRESFGIPMLEAMACGTPVVTSNTSSMPEVSGDAALIVDPYNPEEITSAILDLMKDSEKKNRLIQKGLLRAKAFSWREMAKENVKLYNEVLEQDVVETRYNTRMLFI